MTFRSRDLKFKFEMRHESLTVRGRTTSRNFYMNGNKDRSKQPSRSKSKPINKRCFYRKKQGHLIKHCFKKQRDENDKP